MNEPVHVADRGYGNGQFPPGISCGGLSSFKVWKKFQIFIQIVNGLLGTIQLEHIQRLIEFMIKIWDQ